MTTPSKLNVLLVDDESLVLDVVQSEIEGIGHTVVGRASDGRQGLRLAQELQPDLVLMDIAMPDMDGIEAAWQIQETSPRPVILLTAHEDPGLIQRASQAGVAAYLTKPPNGAELARTIAIALARFADLREIRRLNQELCQTLTRIQQLSGLLPICAGCKQIRDDQGRWAPIETFLAARSNVRFSHGYCPECQARLFPEPKD